MLGGAHGGRRAERAVRRDVARTRPLALLVVPGATDYQSARLPVRRQTEISSSDSVKTPPTIGAPTLRVRGLAGLRLGHRAASRGVGSADRPRPRMSRWRWMRIYNETDVRGAMPAITAPVLLLARERDREALDVSRVAPAPAADPPLPRRGRAEDRTSSPRSWTPSGSSSASRRPRPSWTRSSRRSCSRTSSGSTQKQAAMGDHRWKDVIEQHHAIVRDALGRWRGVESRHGGRRLLRDVRRTGARDPLRVEIGHRVLDLGIEIRAGVHTGECELIDGKISGITVSIGARVAAKAGASEVLVSQTVKDLVAGSGLTFQERRRARAEGRPRPLAPVLARGV